MIRICKNRNSRAVILLALLAALVIAPVFAGNAADNQSPTAIKSIPEMVHEPGRDFRQQAEAYYDIIAPVDDVQTEGLVVGDTYHPLAAKAKVSGAQKGTMVGIILNDRGEIVLCEPVKTEGR